MHSFFPSIAEIEEYKRITDVLLRKILIYLNRRMTHTKLRSLFSQFGPIEEYKIDLTVQHNPCVYITFQNEEDAIRALTDKSMALNNITPLTMRPASYYKQPDNLEQLLLTSDELNRIQNSPSNSYYLIDTNKPTLNMLNDDCLIHIFSFLPILDKVRVEIVCKRWKALSQEYWFTMRTLDFSPSTWGMLQRDICYIASNTYRGVLSRCGKFLREMNFRGGSNCRIENSARSYIPWSSTIDTFSVLGTHCRNLKKFDSGELFMMARDAYKLICACPNLTTVTFRYWEDMEDVDSGLQNFFKRAVKLEHFQICKSYFTGECLLSLPIETMHTLIINGCPVHNIYLSEALERLINLRDLRIMKCNVNTLTMSVINNHCKNLRILKLKCLSQVPMTEFNNTELTNLEALSIRHNCNLTNNVLLNIVRRCSRLTKINVKDCPVTIEGIRNVQQHHSISIKF